MTTSPCQSYDRSSDQPPTDAERTLALQLLADYNSYRTKTLSAHEGRARQEFWRAKPLTSTPARVALLVDVVRWCRAHDIEPRHWMYGLFRARGWRAPPKCDAGSLMSKAMIPKIQTRQGSAVLASRVEESRTQEILGGNLVIDPNVDLITGVETMKANMITRGMHTSCMAQIETTLGFHPKSAVCAQQCPARADCAITTASRFAFDVIGARARGHR